MLSAADEAFLNHLRFVAMSCRVKPRTDLFQACALLQVQRIASCEAHADALMRCLQEALGQPARLHAPGLDELTFDEMWLLELGRATTRGDEDSIVFLLGRRVATEHRRLVRFLVARISECFSLN
ncbi:MAG: hypothetical protein AAFO77_15190 [Pseudomonadota bacterium]